MWMSYFSRPIAPVFLRKQLVENKWILRIKTRNITEFFRER
jgi:hypothetical protein